MIQWFFREWRTKLLRTLNREYRSHTTQTITYYVQVYHCFINIIFNIQDLLLFKGVFAEKKQKVGLSHDVLAVAATSLNGKLLANFDFLFLQSAINLRQKLLFVCP